MSKENNEGLKAQLDANHDWPSVYMFKFIMPNDQIKTNEFLSLFSGTAEVNRKFSKSAKYVSFTVNEVMVSSEAVLERYEQVGKIDGVIPL